MIPEIVTAAADVAVAIENGVGMRRNPPAPPPAPPAVAIPAGGISGAEFLIGIAILALAILAHGLMVRNGLMA
jgi:hypothetical protein